MPDRDPFDELGLSEPLLRRRDLRIKSTHRSRKAARKRRLERQRLSAQARQQPKRPLGKRIARKLFPVAALGFAAALFIGTSLPASAFSTTSSTVHSPAQGKTITVGGQSVTSASGSGDHITRGAFEAMSEAQLQQIQDVADSAGYTVNNTGVIRWPFDSPVSVGDPFGPRIAPCRGCSTFHKGTDFETGAGAPVYAVAAGTVTISEYSGSLGQHVAIDHLVGGKAFTSIYGHFTKGSSPVLPGQVVAKGQFLGLTGSTGESTGPHLDFEIDIAGTPIDSFVWLKANTAH